VTQYLTNNLISVSDFQWAVARTYCRWPV